MRKAIYVFGVVALAGIAYSLNIITQIDVDKHQNSNSIKIDQTTLSESDVKNIQNIIGEKNLHSQINREIFDLTKSSYEILTKNKSDEIIAVVNVNLASLFDCFNKSKCGVADSIVETMIGRHLELIKVAIKNDIHSSLAVNWIVVRECSGLNNKDIRILSLDLIRNYDSQNNGAIKILDIASSYSGEAKAEFFRTFAETVLADERKMFISALKESFSKDDSKTVELIVENINEMNLNKVEIAYLEKSLCHLKSKENWNKIKMAMSSASPDFEKTCL
ncbi:MAG: hypothetical protein ACXVLQ_07770 [Bacteriovorax sp.]